MSKIDKDRQKNNKKSTAFDVVAWSQKQEENHERLVYWFLGRLKELEQIHLSQWEIKFIHSLYDQIVTKGRPMTSKQAVYFDRIGVDLR